jgi:diaminohydroxyphosphoribosylaminopyrimidine deaminase/5-amino-6-(5-phosphoribosylamino)uracil reductase
VASRSMTDYTAKEHSEKTDERLLRRAMELSALGAGQVSPGPLVGCVVASKEGDIVGEGFYLYEGVRHAETIALEQAGDRARGGTAYVSLEPHAHYGRTPPCTDALINAGIARVVAPIEDPNPKVAGRGFRHLREAGIEVIVGILAREAARINEKYLHFLTSGRPFIHLKLACSLDGRIATRTGDSRWITGEVSRDRAHALRSEYDAILVGSGTAMNDDPLLTDRSGRPRNKLLVRVVLDGKLALTTDSQLVRSARDWPLVVFGNADTNPAAASELARKGVEVVNDNRGCRDLNEVVRELAARSVQSVLVEGGSTIAGAFVDSGLVDKYSFFIAPIIIGGSTAPASIAGVGAATLGGATHLEELEITRHGEDIEVTGYPRNSASHIASPAL